MSSVLPESCTEAIAVKRSSGAGFLPSPNRASPLPKVHANYRKTRLGGLNCGSIMPSDSPAQVVWHVRHWPEKRSTTFLVPLRGNPPASETRPCVDPLRTDQGCIGPFVIPSIAVITPIGDPCVVRDLRLQRDLFWLTLLNRRKDVRFRQDGPHGNCTLVRNQSNVVCPS